MSSAVPPAKTGTGARRPFAARVTPGSSKSTPSTTGSCQTAEPSPTEVFRMASAGRATRQLTTSEAFAQPAAPMRVLQVGRSEETVGVCFPS
eukprot:4019915-Prymnesium_polylepis.1